MSQYQFYYDSMIKSSDLTFRIIGVDSTTSGTDVKKSDARVIVRDFIRDPLLFSVTHSYSQNSGGISNFVMDFKTFLSEAGLTIERIRERFKEFQIQLGISENGSLDAAAYQQNVSWIDFFKTFQYSQVNIPLNFNIRLYPKLDSKGNVVSVKDQVISINNAFLSKAKTSDNGTTYTYYPPHGYQPSQGDASTRYLPGSLTLLYGRFAVIESLILTNYQVTFSKELIRTSPISVSQLSPAYADVTVSLEPATVLTQDDIASILASDYYATTGYDNTKGWLTDKGFNSYSQFYDYEAYK